MKNERVIDPKVNIQLPNLLLIPVLSLIYAIIKICGGAATWNWIVTLIIAPMLTYLGWCFGFTLIAYWCIIISRKLKRK